MSFDKISKIWGLTTLFLLTLLNVSFASGQNRHCVDTIFSECYEISKNPKQWVKLSITPDTFYLNRLEEGLVKLTVSQVHPRMSTGHYVTVQRYDNGKWIDVKPPENQIRNGILKVFGESTQFEHPFPFMVYFNEGEVLPGRYRVIKSFNLYELKNENIMLSAEFRVVK